MLYFSFGSMQPCTTQLFYGIGFIITLFGEDRIYFQVSFLHLFVIKLWYHILVDEG